MRLRWATACCAFAWLGCGGEAEPAGSGDADATETSSGGDTGAPTCVPGAAVSCSCADGSLGASVCTEAGTPGTCDCDGDSTSAGTSADSEDDSMSTGSPSTSGPDDSGDGPDTVGDSDDTSETGEPPATPPGRGHLFQPGFADWDILVLRLQWAEDATPSVTAQQANNAAQGYEGLVSSWSYGLAAATVDVAPLILMPASADDYLALGADLRLIRVRADAVVLAADAGYDAADYDAIQIFGQGLPALGMANTRTAFFSGPQGGGGLMHELGHGWMWQHANYWNGPQGSDDPIDPAGSPIEYGDGFDVMGSGVGHINPAYKWHAGWLPDDNIGFVDASGSYTIQRYEADLENAVPNALLIRRDAGSDLWVYYRTNTPGGTTSGAHITWNPHATILGAAKLLDATPNSQPDDWRDAPFAVGSSFVDSGSGIEIAVIEQDATTLTVDVTLPPGAVDTVPSIDFVAPGFGQTHDGMVTYEVTAFDPDDGDANGDGIDTVTLTLQRALDPLGFDLAPPVDVVELDAPPYELTVDTTDGQHPDGHWVLRIVADETTTWYEHVIDNTGTNW